MTHSFTLFTDVSWLRHPFFSHSDAILGFLPSQRVRNCWEHLVFLERVIIFARNGPGVTRGWTLGRRTERGFCLFWSVCGQDRSLSSSISDVRLYNTISLRPVSWLHGHVPTLVAVKLLGKFSVSFIVVGLIFLPFLFVVQCTLMYLIPLVTSSAIFKAFS